MSKFILNQNRIYSFDFMRVLFCFAIVLLHTVSAWMDDPIGNVSFYSSGNIRLFFDLVLLPLFVRPAVPIFFMISGALFLNSSKFIGSNSLFKHIRKLLLVLFFWGVVMSFVELVYQFKNINFVYLFYSVMRVLQENTWSHMWFLYALIGCYFVSPIISTWLNRCSIFECRITVFIMIIFFSFIPSINDYFNLKISSFGFVSFGGAILYFVLGRFLYLNKDNISTLACFIFLGISSIGIILSCFNESLYSKMISPQNIFIMFYSCFLFLLIVKIHLFEVIGKKRIIFLLSEMSLAIYVLHPFTINLIYKGVKIFPSILPPILGELLFFVFFLFCSVFYSFILRKVPILRKTL